MASTSPSQVLHTILETGSISCWGKVEYQFHSKRRMLKKHLSVEDRPVILESPALPVSDGATVILRCKTKKNSSRHSFHFYKDGRSIFNGSTAEMTIHRASKSDEGLYRCITAGGGESEGSWLAVKGKMVCSFEKVCRHKNWLGTVKGKLQRP